MRMGKRSNERCDKAHTVPTVCASMPCWHNSMESSMNHCGTKWVSQVPGLGVSTPDWSSTDPTILLLPFYLEELRPLFWAFFFPSFFKKLNYTPSLKDSLDIWPEVSFLDEWGDPRGNRWNNICKACNSVLGAQRVLSKCQVEDEWKKGQNWRSWAQKLRDSER